MIFDRNALLNINECLFDLRMQLNIVINVSTNNLQKPGLTYIRRTLQFLFRFLRINLEKGTSCHDPYRNMRTSVNGPSNNGKTSERKLTRSQLSAGYK